MSSPGGVKETSAAPEGHVDNARPQANYQAIDDNNIEEDNAISDEDPVPPKKQKKITPKSQRMLDGKIFQKNKVVGVVTYFRCSNRDCHATATLLSGEDELDLQSVHSPCCRQVHNELAIKMSDWMKNETKKSWWKFKDLYNKACEIFPGAEENTDKERLRNNFLYWRSQNFPKNPTTIKELAKKISNNEYVSILHYHEHTLTAVPVNDADGNMHIIVYDKNFVTEYCSNTERMYVDGTFECRPNISDVVQLFTMLGIRANTTVVLFYAIMSKKTTNAYASIFEHAKSICEFAELKLIMSDFEAALRKAISSAFPNVQAVGCNVHLDRALNAKLKPMKGLIKKYPEIKTAVDKIRALAFLPADRIEAEFKRQKDLLGKKVQQRLRSFLEYFENYWIKIVTPKGFSVFGLAVRTNNISESHNSTFLGTYGRRPAINDFLVCTMKIIRRSRNEVEQMLNLKMSKKMPRYQTQYKQSQIYKAWDQLLNSNNAFTTDDFLIAISRLKGDLRIELEIEMEDWKRAGEDFQLQEKPVLVEPEEDIDFDIEVTMDPATRRLNQQRVRYLQKREKVRQKKAQKEVIQNALSSDNQNSEEINMYEDPVDCSNLPPQHDMDENTNEEELEIPPNQRDFSVASCSRTPVHNAAAATDANYDNNSNDYLDDPINYCDVNMSPDVHESNSVNESSQTDFFNNSAGPVLEEKTKKPLIKNVQKVNVTVCKGEQNGLSVRKKRIRPHKRKREELRAQGLSTIIKKVCITTNDPTALNIGS